MFSDGGFELSLVFRACFVGALLDRGLGPPVPTVAVLIFSACFVGVQPASQPAQPASHQPVSQLVSQPSPATQPASSPASQRPAARKHTFSISFL